MPAAPDSRSINSVREPRTERLPELGVARRITSEADLRAVIGHPAPVVCTKISNSLNQLTRSFIEQSPFLCLATTGADGSCDVSPRGDAPGFVRILDDHTLLLPDRPGNRLADALRNIIETGQIGLLFILPGLGESFRVNGRAWITDDVAVLEPSSVEGKAPKLGIVIEISEAFTQCSKAFLRSQLWDPARHLNVDAIPTGGEILALLNADLDPSFDADAYNTARAQRYARGEGMY